MVLLNISKEYNEAIRWFEIASHLEPEEGLCYYNIGLSYFSLKNGEEAIKFFSHAISMNVNDSEAYYMRAYAYAYELIEDYNAAIEDYKMAIIFDAASHKSYNNMAFVYNKMGLHKEAIEACDKALEIMPEKSGAFYNRGIAKFKTGNMKGACDDWQKATELGTDATEMIDLFCN